MVFSERDLEDYICDNQKDFIKTLKNIYGEKTNIKFLGRQVKIGNDNIADLIYYFDEKIGENIPVKGRTYIIVELKYRELNAKDLSQISRYMSSLRDKLDSDEWLDKGYEHYVCGLFVSFGQDHSMQEISINFDFDNISFLAIKNNISFEEEHWSRSKHYINDLKLDERIKSLYGGADE